MAQRTALHALHARHGARFVDFAGWDMPVQYRGILEEHRAVRAAAGLFDVSHMGEVAVAGEGAADYLDRLLTNDISGLRPGRALYTQMCLPTGGVVDDLIVYATGPGEYLLVVNASNAAKDFAWMRERSAEWGFRGRLEDESARWSLLALQGPKAQGILQKVTDSPLGEMRAFDVRQAVVAGARGWLARTGYTGEDGFEIFVPWDEGAAVAEALLAAGAADGLVLVGLGARDSLRLEAGYPLYGHEIDANITPLQAGLGWTVKGQKPADFVGKTALAEEKAAGPARRLVWFRTGDRRIARAGTPVLVGSEVVGAVASGTLSPILNESIGSALVSAEHAESPLEVDLRGARLRLHPVRPPFVTRGKAA